MTAQAQPLLPEDGRPAAGQSHRKTDRHQHRHEQHEAEYRDAAVDTHLGDPATAGQLRFVDMEQRQATHRPDRDSGSRDVHEGRRHEEVDAGLGEAPRQAPQGCTVHLGAAQHGHRIGGGIGDDRVDVIEASPHRHTDICQLDGLASIGDTGAHDPHPVMRVPSHLLDELGGRVPMADKDDVAHEVADAAPTMDELSRAVTAQESQDRGKGEGHDHVTTRDGCVGRPRHGGDGGHHRDGRDEDPAVLLGAQPEETGFVAAGGRHGCQPQKHQGARERDLLPQGLTGQRMAAVPHVGDDQRGQSRRRVQGHDSRDVAALPRASGRPNDQRSLDPPRGMPKLLDRPHGDSPQSLPAPNPPLDGTATARSVSSGACAPCRQPATCALYSPFARPGGRKIPSVACPSPECESVRDEKTRRTMTQGSRMNLRQEWRFDARSVTEPEECEYE